MESSSEKTTHFDLVNLRLGQNFDQEIGVKQQLTTIPVRKPGKQEFVRVHPDEGYCLPTKLLELKDEGETYLVLPALWQPLDHELVPKILYFTISRQGAYRFWPIRLPDEAGQLDTWNRSALAAAEVAKEQWVRVTSNRDAGMYETFVATAALSEPVWPDYTFEQLIEIAFRDRLIDSMDHPVVRRLTEGI